MTDLTRSDTTDSTHGPTDVHVQCPVRLLIYPTSNTARRDQKNQVRHPRYMRDEKKEAIMCTWNDGTAVYLGSRPSRSTSRGVEFIVAPHFLTRVRDVKMINHQIMTIEFQISSQNTGTAIQVYAPTLDVDEQEHADFYNAPSDVVKNCRSHYCLSSATLTPVLYRRKTKKSISVLIHAKTGTTLEND